MTKANSWEEGLLDLLFMNDDFLEVGNAGGLLQSSADGDLFVSLHTGDPGEAGDQETSEITYTSYARVSVARDGAAWVRTGSSVSPNAAITFPAGTGGSGTATHFGIGTLTSGTGTLLYSGTVTPNIVCGSGVTPQLTTATAVTED